MWPFEWRSFIRARAIITPIRNHFSFFTSLRSLTSSTSMWSKWMALQVSKVVSEVCLADPLDLYGLIITLNSDAYLWWHERLMIVDEMDYLISRNQDVLSDLFQLATYPDSCCILMGELYYKTKTRVCRVNVIQSTEKYSILNRFSSGSEIRNRLFCI